MSTRKFYFTNVPLYGNLELEYTIIEDIYPVLSILKNNVDKRFIGIFDYTKSEQQVIINPISNEDIIKVLNNELTLADAFIIGDNKKIVASYNYSTKINSVDLYTASDLNQNDLPVAGEYLDAEPHEHEEYISKLKGN